MVKLRTGHLQRVSGPHLCRVERQEEKSECHADCTRTLFLKYLLAIVRNSIPNVIEENSTPFDFIFVSTKNIPDVPPGISDIIAPAVTLGHTAIVLVQNGLNIEQPLIEAFPNNPVLSGIAHISATESPAGIISHTYHDRLVVGPFMNSNIPPAVSEAAAKRFVAIYDASPGVDCIYESNVRFSRWRKLIYNASFNTVATILGMDVTRIRVSEHVVDNLIRPIMEEIRATAKADGIDLPEHLIDEVIFSEPYESYFKPSMYQDMKRVSD
jgi:2-dehydropantoate 2-reductase